jgi:hypothetical protein
MIEVEDLDDVAGAASATAHAALEGAAVIDRDVISMKGNDD